MMLPRRVVLEVLLSALIFLVSLEIILRIADPWGVAALMDTFEVFSVGAQLSPARGYVLPPGDYHTGHWTATILPDGTRRVPDTDMSAPRRLVILGDSVAFGWGVSDTETWVNLLARDLPGWHVVNTALPGYNIAEIEQNYRAFGGADAYLYLAICNDPVPSSLPTRYERPVSMLAAYLDVAGVRDPCTNGQPYDRRAFARRVGQLADKPCLSVVATDETFGRELAANVPGVRLIPPWTQTVSRADRHPDGYGNAEIAAALLPIVRQIVERACRPVI
jgi:hypothetical protein